MLVYFVLIFCALFCFWLAERTSYRVARCAVFIGFLLLILFPGLRGMVGPDTPNYLLIYNEIAENPSFTIRFGTIEPVFYFLTLTHAKLIGSDLGYLFFISFIQGTFLYFCYTRAKNRFLFIFVYLILFYIEFHFNTLRAGLAALLIMLAIQSKENGKSWVLFFFALGFHISVLIFLPIIAVKAGKRAVLYSIIPIFIVVLVTFFNMDYVFLKAVNYTESSVSRLSTVSVLYSLMVLGTFFVVRRLSVGYVISGLIAVTCYMAINLYPIFYRLITLTAFVYMYFLQNEVAIRSSRSILFPVFLILFLWYGYLSNYGIISLEEQFQTRLQAGDLRVLNALNSLYIPYEFYWDKPYLK
ncbi:EpsG family protein [Paenalcaligenes niemegkensis]|uniref:EpsG family protein n=1 Tax=Paenalcaligenes niemegkensis TaxID=2895469 RepID=UPI001EE88FEB|nr:EpsG family protein [Paenalcaligenes niemegkensis]MCQ9618254.1 EpsG family protein [Paenalcaligenes niemegkensis]